MGGSLIAQLVQVGPGVEFAQGGDLRAGFDITGVDEIGDFPAGFGGEITESQHTGLFQKFNKFSFVAFHKMSSCEMNGRYERLP